MLVLVWLALLVVVAQAVLQTTLVLLVAQAFLAKEITEEQV
jgi:hypothetical protein